MEDDQEKAIGPVKHRISIGGAFLLTGLALIADLVGLIPFAEAAVGTIFWAIAGFLLYRMGMGIVNWRRLVPGLISWVAGFIPIIQALPQLTAGIVAIFILSRVEEKTGVSMINKISTGGGRAPLNSGGVRNPQAPSPALTTARNADLQPLASSGSPVPLNSDGVRGPKRA